MPNRSALDLLDDLEMLLSLLRRKVISNGDSEEMAKDIGFIQQYAAAIRQRLDRQTGKMPKLDE